MKDPDGRDLFYLGKIDECPNIICKGSEDDVNFSSAISASIRFSFKRNLLFV